MLNKNATEVDYSAAFRALFSFTYIFIYVQLILIT